MKTYNELNKQRIIFLEKERKVREVKEIFENRDINVGDTIPPSCFWNIFDEYIEELESKQKELWQKMDKLEENCAHEWIYEGSDSHYSYEVCKICGKSEKL